MRSSVTRIVSDGAELLRATTSLASSVVGCVDLDICLAPSNESSESVIERGQIEGTHSLGTGAPIDLHDRLACHRDAQHREWLPGSVEGDEFRRPAAPW